MPTVFLTEVSVVFIFELNVGESLIAAYNGLNAECGWLHSAFFVGGGILCI